MKIKWVTETEEVVCMGEMPGLQPGPGEQVKDVTFAAPSEPLWYFTFDGGNSLTRKSQEWIDQQLTLINFSVDLLAAGLSQAFDLEAQVQLEGSFAVLQGYARAKVFTGAKSVQSYMAALVNNVPQKMTPEQYEIIRAVILTQGIDIGALA